MKLFNSLTHQKDDFAPAGQTVSLYTCGPTVYNYAHIGNLRTFLFYDVLRRTLESNGWSVNHVMNITDVGHLTDDGDAGDDKMEKGAAREGKSVWDIATLYTDAFLDDARSLNLLPPTKLPRATDHIDEQIALVQRLEERGHTYTISDGVYYDTSTFPDYGKMAQLDFDGQQEGARVEANTEKRNPTDFALWKFSPADMKRAMEWDSPWGVGFPGWHLECSAMAMKYLGETMDIHAGGIDHLPVHHTNEIAQSEGATGKPFARFWLHGEFLLMNDGKMSKSDGTFVTLRDLVERGFDPLSYRYLVLGAHYRSKLNFSWQAMEGAQKGYTSLISRLQRLDVSLEKDAIDPALADEKYITEFQEALANDLNTPEALRLFREVIIARENDNHIRAAQLSPEVRLATVANMDVAMGLSLIDNARELDTHIKNAGDDVLQMVKEREDARDEKNFEKADQLRDKIEAAGFIVEDTADGSDLRIV